MGYCLGIGSPMKKHLLLPLLACTAFFSFPGLAQMPGKPVLYLTKPLAAEAITAVEAQTSGGGIEITGGYNQDARIEVYVMTNGIFHELSKDEIDRRLREDYDFSIMIKDHKLTAIARTKRGSMNWKKDLNISYKIYVPENVSTQLNTSGGGIHLSNLSGDEDFHTSGGGLHVSRLRGKIRGGTSGGGIHVADSRDDIDLSTSGGGIEASHCTGKIRLVTSGGSLHLDSLSGTINASTSGGSIHCTTITGELHAGTSGGNVSLQQISGNLEASTSGGNITAEIISPGKFITLSNSGGHIDLQVPKDKGFDLRLNGKVKTEGLTGFSGTTEEGSMRGSVNGGGTSVDVDAGGGRIRLSFQ
jgi:DUF4097 and DUF4098 domain-containing protein YvlB